MWKNKTRLVIWKLDNLLGLEKVKELLAKNYNHTIDFLKKYDLEQYDKELQNKWISPDGKNVEIQNINLLGQNFRYISAVGMYETNFGENRSIIDNIPLPREVRIFNHAVKVIFFEFVERVYCVLEITKSQESRVRSALFGQRRGHKMEEWGELQFNEPMPFSFPSRFYYWLFSRKGQTLSFNIDTRKQTLKVIDVAAISHLAEREAYDSSSVGAGLLSGSIPALSGLGSNEDVYQAGFKLLINNSYFMINLGENGVCVLDSKKSYYLETDQEGETLKYIDSNFEYFVLMIYGVIFPKLLEKYNKLLNEGLWDDISEEGLRRSWALKVIKELSIHNNIEFADLKELLEQTTYN